MARIRTIKPDFFTSEQIVDCSPTSRLLFIGMWCFCDDGGVHPASVKTLKMQVLPADVIGPDQIGAAVAELIAAGLLYAYTVAGKDYWLVTGWHAHQKIERPSYRYPMPNGQVPIQRTDAERWSSIRRPIDEHSSNSHRTDVSQDAVNNQFGESSSSVRRTLIDCHPPEGKGMEEEGKKEESPPTPSLTKSEASEKVNNLPLEKITGTAPTYHAMNFHPRYNEVREYIVTRLPPLGRTNATEVNRWLLEGADPERDIFDTVDFLIKTNGGNIRSFKYFGPSIESSVAARRDAEQSYRNLLEKCDETK